MSGVNDHFVTTEVKPASMNLLVYMVQVREWILAGDPQGQPFLDRDACRVTDGEVSFHKGRFCEMYVEFLRTKGQA